MASQPTLTPREIEVLQYLSQGMRTDEVAHKIGVHINAAWVHTKCAEQKLGAKSRTHAGPRRCVGTSSANARCAAISCRASGTIRARRPLLRQFDGEDHEQGHHAQFRSQFRSPRT
jgi:DNA-binding CsgD family transcriptional regulator